MIRYRIHEFISRIRHRWSQEVAAWRSTKSLLRGKYRYAGRVPYGDK